MSFRKDFRLWWFLAAGDVPSRARTDDLQASSLKFGSGGELPGVDLASGLGMLGLPGLPLQA